MSDRTWITPPTAVDADATQSETAPPSVAVVSSALAGRYALLALVGCGGMGNVYRAHDRELDEVVALKMLRGVSSAAAIEQLKQETKLARRVTHPSVVRTFDIGEHEASRFITMEYVEGEPLSSRLKREGRLAMTDIHAIADAIASGLTAAHAVGVVHRDLKPANILLGRDGAKITDFGIASPHDGLSDGSGTPAFMAPEQLELMTVDARTDVYSFGLILFQMLTGRPPFVAKTFAEALEERSTTSLLDPSQEREDTAPELVALVLGCTAHDPAARPDAAEAARRLAKLRRESSLEPSGLVSARRATRDPERQKAVAVMDVVALDLPSVNVALGLTEDLVAALSRAPSLRLCARTLIARHATLGVPVAEVAERVGARAVLTGELRSRGDDFVGSFRLTSNDGLRLWGQDFEGSRARLLALHGELARAVASALDDESLVLWTPSAAVHPDAAELYVRARAEYQLRFSDGTARALELLREALALAPDEPRILAAHATASSQRFEYDSADRADLEIGTRSVDRALEIAPLNGEAHLARSFLLASVGEMNEAARARRRALACAPWNGEVHAAIGESLAEAGDVERGIRHLREGMELDAKLLFCRYDLAHVYALTGAFERAEIIAGPPPEDPRQRNQYWWQRLRVLIWDPDPARLARARAYLDKDQSAMKRWARPLLDALVGRIDEQDLLALGQLARSRGPSKRGVGLFARTHADLLGRLGRADAAMEAVSATDDGCSMHLAWLDRSPSLAALRGRADFRALRERVAARARAYLAAYDAEPALP